MNDTRTPLLPELSEQRIDEIEHELFVRIGDDRQTRQRRSARRGRWWIAGGAAAAVVAVAAIIAPSVGGIVAGSSGADSAAVQPASGGGFAVLPEGSVVELEGTEIQGTTVQGLADTAREESGAAPADRDIITTATASVTVDDVQARASEIGDDVAAVGGYVESMNIGTTGAMVPVDPTTGMVYDSRIAPPVSGAWISVRVPSTELAGFIATLDEYGDVTSSSINRQDVTDQAVDLDARISAAEASVDRLTQLMAQAGDLSDLIAAESALAERQASLESLQQQRDMLGDQVAMSSLTISLSPVVETVEADPAGFGDGLFAGWNGLVATLNGIVVALGFLLPWLAVAGVAWLVVWAILRSRRRRREKKAADAAARRAAASDELVP